MVTLESATTSLLARYAAADTETRDRGRAWYAEARRACREIARESGYTYRRVAAVLAITSPDAQLVTNVGWTRAACLSHGATAGRYPTDQLPKVAEALHGKRPSRAARGPKVEAFYRAIMGDPDVLVIDRWASFAAGGPRDRVPPAKLRRVIAEAYAQAAAHCGESVRDFQAIVWIQCRESDAATDTLGRYRRYQDITSRQEVAA